MCVDESDRDGRAEADCGRGEASLPALRVARTSWGPDGGRHGGMGRVAEEVCARWRGADWMEARWRMVRIPAVGWWPWGLDIPEGAQVLWMPRSFGAAVLNARRPRIPVVVLVHDVGALDCAEDRRSLGPLRVRWIRQSFLHLGHATKIIVDSRFTRARLLALVPTVAPEQLVVVPLGVSEIFRTYRSGPADARARVAERVPGLGGRWPWLAYAGDEAPRKNMGLLLDTMVALRRRWPAATLIKAGSARSRAARTATLTHMRQRGLVAGRDVVFVDACSDPLLADVYGAADVFLSASLYEGFGLPPLEAMACGAFVVATNCGAFPELLGGYAVLSPPTRDAFARAVAAALAAPPDAAERERRRRYARGFTWERTASAYAAVVQDVAARS